MKLSLEKLQELYPEGKLDRRKKNIIGKCPMCQQDTFGIALADNHKFGCHRGKCGFRGNIFILAKYFNRTDLLNIEGNVGQQQAKLENKLIKSEIPLDLTLPTIKMPLGWKQVTQNDYLESRGFTEYERYKPGQSAIHPRLKKNYIIFPIEDEGEIKGYISRHVWSKEKIKEENEKRKAAGQPEILRYINSDSDFSKMLYGTPIIKYITKTVICVEGIFDVFNLSKILSLYDQSEIACKATFKAAISEEQIYKMQLDGIENIILFYDSDVISAVKKAAGELSLYFNVLIAFNSFTDADAGDIDKETLTKVFSNLQTPTNFSINKINFL